jgi:hypothetical protein
MSSLICHRASPASSESFALPCHRQFCTRCGGHLMTHPPTFGLTDVRAAVLPRITFKPVIHLHYAETVLPMKDGLPKHRTFLSRREDPANWCLSSRGSEATAAFTRSLCSHAVTLRRSNRRNHSCYAKIRRFSRVF